MRGDVEVATELIPTVVMRVPSGLMLGFMVGVIPVWGVVIKVPSGLILGFVVEVPDPPPDVMMNVPSGLRLGFMVGVIPVWGVVVNVPLGLILGFVVGLVVVPGLVPGPPGPKPGDMDGSVEEGEFEEEA